MAKPLIVANWKMNHGVAASLAFGGEFHKKFKGSSKVEIVICPPYTSLVPFKQKYPDLLLGAQNCHWEDDGAYTGEVSPRFLKEIGCQYVLAGHSERRHLFGESDDWIGRKMEAALKAGLIPILCVGETLDQREKGKTLSVVKSQIQKGLAKIRPGTEEIVIAYEPVWAIGTGKNATPDEAETVHRAIRAQIPQFWRILYGGSVTPQNAKTLIAMPDIDGALVGGAALRVDSFIQIINDAEEQC